MSVEASSWVWNHSEATGTARLVLLRIADQADKCGANSWPGMATIAQDCRIAKLDTVRAAIRRLVAIGELVVYVNAGGNRDTRNDRRPNRFDLPKVPGYQPPDQPDTTPQERGPRDDDPPFHGPPSDGSTTPRSRENDPPFHGSTTPPERGAYPSMIHPDPPIDTPEQPQLLDDATGCADADTVTEPVAPGFEEFWTAYPLKRGKKAAARGWARLSKPNRRLALDRLPAYLASIRNPEYIQHGSTYVSQQTWLDFDTPPGLQHGAGDSDPLEAARRWNEQQAARRAELDAEAQRRGVNR